MTACIELSAQPMIASKHETNYKGNKMNNLKLKSGQDILNKIKFKDHHDQLRLLRHNYSNYDSVITDTNWKKISKQFYYGIVIYYPHLVNAAHQWYKLKLSNNIR